jgi:iron(III) transport system permease protein
MAQSTAAATRPPSGGLRGRLGMTDRGALLVGLLIAAALLLFVLWPTVRLLVYPEADHWVRFFTTPRFLTVTRNTLVMTLLATVTATAVGFVFAYALSRPDMPGRPIFRVMSILPLVSPPFAIGLAIILLFGRRGLVTHEWLGLTIDVYGWQGLWLAQTIGYYPVAALVLSAVLRSQGPSLEWAAHDLGQNWWGIMRSITMPLAIPGLASAALLVGMNVLTDFGNPLLIGGSFRVLAVESYTQVVGLSNLGMGAVLSVMLVVPTLTFFFIQRRWLGGEAFVTVSGKESSLSPLPTPRGIKWTLFSILAVVSLFVGATYATIIMGAFTTAWGANWTLTMDHVEYMLLRSGDLRNSATYALIAGLICAFTAVLAAYFVHRRPMIGGRFFDTLAVLPGALPGTMVGIAWLLTFNTGAVVLTGTATIIVLNMVMRTLPVGYRAGVAALEQVGPSMDESASDLGAGAVRTFGTIMLPLLKTAFTAAFVYSFIESINTLSAVIFLVSPGNQLASVSIMGLAENGYWGEATALSAGLIVITLGVLLLFRVLGGGRVKFFDF